MATPRLDLKGHVDDQVVVLWLHEEDRDRHEHHPARRRCALERDDAEVINSLALQLRGKTQFLALYRGIKNWELSGPRVRDYVADRFEDARLRL